MFPLTLWTFWFHIEQLYASILSVGCAPKVKSKMSFFLCVLLLLSYVSPFSPFCFLSTWLFLFPRRLLLCQVAKVSALFFISLISGAKCRFSHDIDVGRKVQKIDLYTDMSLLVPLLSVRIIFLCVSMSTLSLLVFLFLDPRARKDDGRELMNEKRVEHGAVGSINTWTHCGEETPRKPRYRYCMHSGSLRQSFLFFPLSFLIPLSFITRSASILLMRLPIVSMVSSGNAQTDRSANIGIGCPLDMSFNKTPHSR